MGKQRQDKEEPRETWRDRLPAHLTPSRLITRAQLLEELAEGNAPVPERRLRDWEAEGILPRPVLQKHDDKAQAVYPYWWHAVVLYVAARREAKAGLAAIANDLPRFLADWAAMNLADEYRLALLNVDVFPALIDLVREESARGRRVARVFISFQDEDGVLLRQYGWLPTPEQVSNGPENPPPFDT